MKSLASVNLNFVFIGIISVCLSFLFGCSVGYYGDKVGEEVKHYRELQGYYNQLESDYIVVLENLTLAPNDSFLITERNRIDAELLQVRTDLEQARSAKEHALRGLEKEVVQKQTESLFTDSVKTDTRKRLEKQLMKKGVNLKVME